MLTDARLEYILQRIPHLTVAVLGDLFLDRYLDIDATLTEPSIETDLDAYQVTRVRSVPGAAGTVINNLVALGVRCVMPVSVIGDDGEGHELRQALAKLNVIDARHVIQAPDRRTPTYTKPMLHAPGQAPRELNRLDIKNRSRLSAAIEDQIIQGMKAVSRVAEGLIVLDQVTEEDCGVVTNRVRKALADLARNDRTYFILADSRVRIGEFRSVCVKPNIHECLAATEGSANNLAAGVNKLALKTDAVVFCTQGENGILVGYPEENRAPQPIPGFPVKGPIDIVGAGDSTSAGITCAILAGASPEEAAAFGNLVASITVQQIGTTGTASPEQVRQRWREVRT